MSNIIKSNLSNIELEKSKLELYDWQLNHLKDYAILDYEYTLDLKEKSIFTIYINESILLTELYFVQFSTYFGRIIRVSQNSENKYQLEIAVGKDAFDYEITLENNFIEEIEVFIAEKISEFNNKNFSYINNLEIEVTSLTEGYIVFDETISLSEFMSQVKRLYDIEVDIIYIEKYFFKVVIGKKPNNRIEIAWNDAEVIKYELNFSNELPTKVTVVDKNNNEYNFYLCTNGEVDDDYNPDIDRVRLPTIKNQIKVVSDVSLSSESEARPYAEEILLGSENNEIVLEYDTSNIGANSLINSIVDFILPNEQVVTARITKIESDNKTPIKTITLGASRKRLTDVVKKLKGVVLGG